MMTVVGVVMVCVRCVAGVLVLRGDHRGAAGGLAVPAGLEPPARQPAGAVRVRQVRILLAQSERNQVIILLSL